MHGKSVMLLENCHHSEILVNMVDQSGHDSRDNNSRNRTDFCDIVMKVLFLYRLKKNLE